MVSSLFGISVDNKIYCGRNESFGQIYKFSQYESKQCKNITGLGFATGPSLNLSERQPISSKQYENNYRWPQMMTGQYITMSVNQTSTIFGLVSMAIE